MKHTKEEIQWMRWYIGTKSKAITWEKDRMNFEKIKNDEEIIEIYQRIKELEEKNKNFS